MAERLILHMDMDCFFAAVEQRDNLELRGKPVIVGGLSSRGVVSTASYEARKYGVHSAMPMALAKRKCPQGIFLTGNYHQYKAVSAQIFEILVLPHKTVYGVTVLVDKLRMLSCIVMIFTST